MEEDEKLMFEEINTAVEQEIMALQGYVMQQQANEALDLRISPPKPSVVSPRKNVLLQELQKLRQENEVLKLDLQSKSNASASMSANNVESQDMTKLIAENESLKIRCGKLYEVLKSFYAQNEEVEEKLIKEREDKSYMVQNFHKGWFSSRKEINEYKEVNTLLANKVNELQQQLARQEKEGVRKNQEIAKEKENSLRLVMKVKSLRKQLTEKNRDIAELKLKKLLDETTDAIEKSTEELRNLCKDDVVK